MRKGFPLAGLALLAAALVPGAAVAATVTSPDGVFRYRAQPGESIKAELGLSPQGAGRAATHFRTATFTTPSPQLGAGCEAGPDLYGLDALCTLSGWPPRYRASLSDRDDTFEVLSDRLVGVTYAGAGSDAVTADTVFGGRGQDFLYGQNVYGGPGDDVLGSEDPRGLRRLRGGPGDDSLVGPGWLYGGPGADELEEDASVRAPGPEMMVGGPGPDSVTLDSYYPRRTVVRLRGGGADSIVCDRPPDRIDVLFVDSSDDIDPACHTALVRLTGRPRIVR